MSSNPFVDLAKQLPVWVTPKISEERARVRAGSVQSALAGAEGGLPPNVIADIEAFSEEFQSFFRFGLIDNGFLVVAALAGFGIEDWIAAKTGVSGYGPILGATVGNALSDALAAAPEGRNAVAGVFSGAMLPVLPIAFAMMTGRPLTGGTGKTVGLISFAMLMWAFTNRSGRAATA